MKCPNCGASDLEDAGNDMIRCPCCGAVQARANAKKYMEQAKAEILAEVSKLIPAGINLAQTENMDPIARHNIFQNSVKSSIDSQYREYKFEYIAALNHQLIAVPFRTLEGIRSKYDSKQLYMFDEKVKSVTPLAVDDTGKSMLKTASALAVSYATVLNNIKLLSEVDHDRYLFMGNNFKISSQALSGLEDFKVVVDRFNALTLACEGFDNLMNGRTAEATSQLKNAQAHLSSVKDEASKSLDYGAMVSSIAKELAAIETGVLISGMLSNAPNLDPSSALLTVKDFMDEINTQESRFATFGGQWTTVLKRTERSNDLFRCFSDVTSEKTGNSVLRIARGTGQYFIPMWAIDLKYSFVTGSLFKKKAVQVTETVLVSAMFMTSKDTFMDPKLAVTDIFGSMPESTFMQRVKGEETSITMGGAVRALVDQSAVGPISAESKIIIPVTTKQEAEMLCKEYVEKAKTSHPKLTMGNPIANCLVYVPCNIDGNNVRLSIDLQGMAPEKYGNISTLQKLSI